MAPESASQKNGWASASCLATTGSAHVLGQTPADPGDLVAHVLRGRLHVALEVELESDVAEPFGAGARKGTQSLDRAELLLQDVGDRRLDDLRVRARELGAHRHDRRVDVRELAYRQPGVPDGTEQHQRQAHHAGEHGPADGEIRELHEKGPCSSSDTYLGRIRDPRPADCCPTQRPGERFRHGCQTLVTPIGAAQLSRDAPAEVRAHSWDHRRDGRVACGRRRRAGARAAARSDQGRGRLAEPDGIGGDRRDHEHHDPAGRRAADEGAGTAGAARQPQDQLRGGDARGHDA